MKRTKHSVCEICKKGFLGYSNRENRFCSRACCGKSKIGKPTWIKGRKATWNTGKLNHKWKETGASEVAMHNWVVRQKGEPFICEHCGVVGLRAKDGRRLMHWANIGHTYRRFPADYISLCISCHRKFDNSYFNLHKHLQSNPKFGSQRLELLNSQENQS